MQKCAAEGSSDMPGEGWQSWLAWQLQGVRQQAANLCESPCAKLDRRS
jgi:hypothetical protein